MGVTDAFVIVTGILFSAWLIWMMRRPMATARKAQPLRSNLSRTGKPKKRNTQPLRGNMATLNAAQEYTKIFLDLYDKFQEDVDPEDLKARLSKCLEILGFDNRDLSQDILMEYYNSLPRRETLADDTCGECGKSFAMVDDYLCPECRSRR